MEDSTRELIVHIFLVLHILGIAALLAGFFTSMKDMKTGMKVNAGVLHGAYTMLVTGLVMAGVTNPADLNTVVISLKSISLTAIFFIAYTYRKKEVTPKWAVPAIFLLTTLNIVFAVLIGAAE
ncbi:MAG: hypothetical protein RJA75_84 [Actinomycetota bacterium]|jgi:hypothetical protein